MAISQEVAMPWRETAPKAAHPGVGPSATRAPTDLWTADFKGEFQTGDGEYCDPLTVADLHTRCLLECRVLLVRIDERTGTLNRG